VKAPRVRRIALAAIPLVVLAAAAAVLVVYLRRPPSFQGQALQDLLASLDASISGGYLSTAADALASLRQVPRGERDQLRLLKRAYLVGTGSGDFSLLANLAGRMLGAGGGARVREVAAYASLRAGRVSDAQGILGRGSTAGAATEALRGEALLRGRGRWQGSDELMREVLALEGSADPGAFAQAATRSDDRRLALDAALVAMENGSPAAAASIARSELGESRFDEAAGVLLYDAGAFDEAAARLERRELQKPGIPTIGFLLADVASAAGNQPIADAWLLRTLPLAPSLSWTPYANLAVSALGRGDTAAALRRLEDGLAFFPRSRELRVMKARVLVREGDLTGSSGVLGELVAEQPSDVESALLLLSVQGPQLSPEASRGRLWKLFDLVAADTLAFDTLCAALIAARDWEGMRIAVAQHELAGGQTDARGLMLKGFAAAMSGDREGAIGAFRQADLAARDGTARFDLALVMIQKGSTRAARDELEAAADEVRATAAPQTGNALLSRIEMLRAAALMLEGSNEGAVSALSRAQSLDPGNLRAALLAQKLEAGYQ
jgi:tetratricopeptide (TPR) repeat protein